MSRSFVYAVITTKSNGGAMTWEALWYRMYRDDGQPPKMRRLNRLPTSEQLAAIPDLAIAFVEGRAGYRPVFRSISLGGMRIVEEYWYWPNTYNREDDTGWWLIPLRTAKRAQELIRRATEHECRRHHGGCHGEQIAQRLRVWQRRGQWRRYLPVRALDSQGYGAWYQQTFEPPVRRRRRPKKAAAVA